MTDIEDIDAGAHLRSGDPLIDEPAMSPADVEAMRRTVVAAAERSAQEPSWWPPMIAVLATASAMVIAVVGARVRDKQVPRRPPATAAIESASATSTGRRQLQFSTPGGTRVIWVFDPEFNP